MNILKIEFTDLQGAKKVIDKKEYKFTYAEMLEQLNFIYLNCSGEIKTYLKGGEIKIYNK